MLELTNMDMDSVKDGLYNINQIRNAVSHNIPTTEHTLKHFELHEYHFRKAVDYFVRNVVGFSPGTKKINDYSDEDRVARIFLNRRDECAVNNEGDYTLNNTKFYYCFQYFPSEDKVDPDKHVDIKHFIQRFSNIEQYYLALIVEDPYTQGINFYVSKNITALKDINIIATTVDMFFDYTNDSDMYTKLSLTEQGHTLLNHPKIWLY